MPNRSIRVRLIANSAGDRPDTQRYRLNATSARGPCEAPDPPSAGFPGPELGCGLSAPRLEFIQIRGSGPNSPGSEVQDQPEHPETDASERCENESAVDSHREFVGWASDTCLGYPCRTPDRSFTKRPETAPTDHPPTRLASSGSRIILTLVWEGVLGKRIDIRIIQVSKNDATGPSRTVEPVSCAAFGSEELVDPVSLRSVDLRLSSHGISFGGVKGSALLRERLRMKCRLIRAETGQSHDQFGSVSPKRSAERSRSALRGVQAPNAFVQFPTARVFARSHGTSWRVMVWE